MDNGVFLLLAFTRLGKMNVRIFWAHAIECMCEQTRHLFNLSSKKVSKEWSQKPCYLQGKNFLLQEAQWKVKPAMLHYAGQWALRNTDWAIPAPNPLQTNCDQMRTVWANGTNRLWFFLTVSILIKVKVAESRAKWQTNHTHESP